MYDSRPLYNQPEIYLSRILLIDIETAPNKVWSWGLWDQTIGTNQVEETSYTLCWAAKWLGSKEVMFDSVKKSGLKNMMKRMHDLLNEADVVIHYNGCKFDVPTLNKEFIILGFPPPSPYKQIDCMREVKRMFRFQSNKLAFVSESLGIGSKIAHEGFELWVKCMDPKRKGHASAWKRMKDYNREDVKLLEKLYKRLRPWIKNHPNVSEHDGKLACPKCASKKYQQRGWAGNSKGKYARMQCLDCFSWFRDTKEIRRGKAQRSANA